MRVSESRRTCTRVFTTSERSPHERLCERLTRRPDHGQPRLVAWTRSLGATSAARTHGDLWERQRHVTPGGAVLIPAAQGRHAEEDLAALAVFGCPTMSASSPPYNEARP